MIREAHGLFDRFAHFRECRACIRCGAGDDGAEDTCGARNERLCAQRNSILECEIGQRFTQLDEIRSIGGFQLQEQRSRVVECELLHWRAQSLWEVPEETRRWVPRLSEYRSQMAHCLLSTFHAMRDSASFRRAATNGATQTARVLRHEPFVARVRSGGAYAAGALMTVKISSASA